MNSIIEQDILKMCENEALMEKICNHRIVVTGATGFIGSFVIRAVLKYAGEHGAKDTKMIAVVRNRSKAEAMFQDLGEACESLLDYIVVSDIADPFTYNGDVDYVIHCASNAGPREYGEDPVGTILGNVKGTENLLKFAKEKNVKKFMYVSTIEVYGNTSERADAREAEGLYTMQEENGYGVIPAQIVRSCYPLSKKMCENLCISYMEQYGVPTVIGRLSYIYGPGMKENDSKVVAAFPRSVVKGEDIVLKSKASQKRSYTYITDAIEGLLTVLACGNCKEAYNIANRNSVFSISELAQMLIELADNGTKVTFDLPSETEQNRFSFIADAVMDTKKIEEIGFKAKVLPREGLQRVLDSLR